MLKDSLPSYQSPKSSDFSVEQDVEVNLILSFIDNYISDFSGYYLSLNDSEKENRISDLLVHYLEICKDESKGYFPFRFSKNPTQTESTKETDIGIFVRTRNRKPIPIFEFEAKRFSETSNNKEYVCGIRGGIERFKRGHHSSHLKVCGMFGYVQSRTSLEWIKKVNNWIEEMAENNTDESIDWTGSEERLIMKDSLPSVEKLYSLHSRKSSNDNIILWHFLIDLLCIN
ncbi:MULTISPECIES: hypothetical protein [Flavobacteriaceae]|uniref:hypothetical protein n=1 Tax=Flavobacteriaceae TaxID=49546 RepID=UPI00055FEA4B|nr:hypothetical protein [Muricauda sp. MAR_2010_75]